MKTKKLLYLKAALEAAEAQIEARDRGAVALELHEALKAADQTFRDERTYDIARRAMCTWWKKSIEATITAETEAPRMRAVRQMADRASKHGAVQGAIREWWHESR